MTRTILLALLALMPLACNRGGSRPTITDGPVSPPGWEVRYNAVAALARRGSDKIADERVRETLLEMLDEEQQLRNFPVRDEQGQIRKDREGRVMVDTNAARLTVVTTLHALTELRRKQASADLAAFRPAIEKLTQSPNIAVSTEAKKALQLIYDQ